ncbi:putative duf974 domain-containing protein [Rosellinia necatrix]|uniref:Putative duf974 domain-containing protein n=1 Tax=Rosellinia necatrix TaxID=77044 RepID=A0A1S7UKC2_ROSNE|nr:putative duf974 domain-containing protein [Rosellinia necatrix]
MRRALAPRFPRNAFWLVERRTRSEPSASLLSSVRTTYSSTRRSNTHPLSRQPRGAPWTVTQNAGLHMEANASTTIASEPDSSAVVSHPTRSLPRQCTGCGALSQTSSPNQAGYFDLNRKSIQEYMNGKRQSSRPPRNEDRFYEEVMSQFHQNGSIALSPPPEPAQSPRPMKRPLCDRCHLLFHNNTGESIYHPSMDAILDTLVESPYKYNHVYHVLDAADFPMSLLDNISQLLETMPLRSKNRRSRIGRFYHGQKTEITFVITRIDLLAPTEAQADTLFQYLREVLRAALNPGRTNIRLGNVIAVSAKRGWWVRPLREDVWKRGGGGWLVGKANVGKSLLFETIFPKGRMDWDPSRHQITVDMEARSTQGLASQAKARDSDNEYSLLPPAREETQYPMMPLVSSLPGTTASPIRIPFGNGRGELIDMPGLERTGLENHVMKEHHSSLVMRSRIVPEQIVIKSGQSLLLGGFIRITPRPPAPVILSYDFTPIKPHVCRTDKAISIQNQTGEVNVENIALPGTGDKTKLAGSFQLMWDVTKERSGPLTRKSAVNLNVDSLPFRVLSADILIEGVGWVELVCQVRKKELYGRPPRLEAEEMETGSDPNHSLSSLEQLEASMEGGIPQVPKEDDDDGPNWPIIDVYSPEGRFIGIRPPMNGWEMNKPRSSHHSPPRSPNRWKKRAKELKRV